MADKPIIFSAPMVKALLDGRKSQTRRALKPAKYSFQNNIRLPDGANAGEVILTFAPGDRLWVREAWRTSPYYDDLKPSDLGGDESIRYETDGQWESWGWGDLGCEDGGRYRHARFMPRWASRLTLIVTDVRVQRLQEISEGDARAEGAIALGADESPDPDHRSFVWGFSTLWNSLHGPDAWDANPWVAALTFTTHRRNIDQMEAAYG